MPSYDIIAVSKLTPTMAQIESGRPSYINAVLIQSRGVENTTACTSCRRAVRPFDSCVSLEGFWEDCCGNCKWRERNNQCEGLVTGTRTIGIEGNRIIELADDEE